MRGRDNGLPSYNELRQSYNLPVREWKTINPMLYKERPQVEFFSIFLMREKRDAKFSTKNYFSIIIFRYCPL